MNSHSNVKRLIITALFIALNIILVRFLKIEMPMLRIDFGFLPLAIIAIMYGPIWGGIAAILADILGIAINMPPNPFFGFTLTYCLTGLIFGLILYKKEISIPKVTIAVLLVCLICNLCLDTYWLHILYGKALVGMLPARILKVAIMIPIEIITIYHIWHKVIKKVSY